MGLGEGGNEDSVSCVEPYEFANRTLRVCQSSRQRLGSTVSTSVYDRSVTQRLFLGVAALDLYVDAFEQVLGEAATSSNMLDRFVMLSAARCPRIKLTSEFDLDALHFQAEAWRRTKCCVSHRTRY